VTDSKPPSQEAQEFREALRRSLVGSIGMGRFDAEVAARAGAHLFDEHTEKMRQELWGTDQYLE
jgi:hypothetical protein